MTAAPLLRPRSLALRPPRSIVCETRRGLRSCPPVARSAFFLPPPQEQNEEQKKALRDYEAAFKHDLKGWATVFQR
jgi:hypothetical protein